MSIKKALALFKKLVVSGTNDKDALAQASRMYAIPEKRIQRAAKADVLANAEGSLAEFAAGVPKLSSETLRTRIEELERILGNLDKEPESPLQVLRQAHVDAISAARNELDRRKI